MQGINSMTGLIKLLDTTDLAGTLNSEIKVQNISYTEPTRIMKRQTTPNRYNNSPTN